MRDRHAVPAKVGGPATTLDDRPDWSGGLLLLLLLALGTALRALEAFRTPLWFDEIYILDVVGRPLGAALNLVARDIHPPLYYLVRWAWTAIGGAGDTWQKILSVLIAAASLWATYRLARLMFGWRTGLAALALVAVNGAHIHYGQEVENYALAWFLMLMAAGSAWAYTVDPKPARLVGFMFWSVLALYDHYLAMAVLAVVAVWGLVRVGGNARARSAWLAALIVIAIAYVPQARVFWEQFRREGSGSFFTFPVHADYAEIWRLVSFNWHPLMPLLFLLALLPLLKRSLRPGAVLLWLLILLPLLEKRWWVVILPREGLLVVSLAAGLVAAGISMIPGRVVRGLLIVALVVVGFRAATRRTAGGEPMALDQLARVIGREIRPGEPIVHAETHSLLFFRHRFPHARNLLLRPSGKPVPYFDAGLVIPDSVYVDAEKFGDIAHGGGRWWGVQVDRAFVTHGVVSRAGSDAIWLMEAAPRDSEATVPPARMIRGKPAS